MRHKLGQTMLLATLSTNSATATDGIDAEWKTVVLCPYEHTTSQRREAQQAARSRHYCQQATFRPKSDGRSE